MTEFLLALILAGAGLHISLGAERQEKHSDVKYKGPVVYTNLPPPVLYFPSFPPKPKLSNRGSSGDTEDKRVEYIPYPYKDLPLLVYQTDNQPPVHVVERNPNSEKDGSGPSQAGVGYQTGPALYRIAENGQYDNDGADSTSRPQAIITNSNEKFINVGLSTSPSTDASNQQFISIGVTSIQPQASDVHSQSNTGPSHSSGIYNPEQYSSNADHVHYASQNSESLAQSGPALVYYPTQYNSESQPQIPVDQLTQVIQNYLLQQSAASGIQQTLVSYPGKEDNYASVNERSPAQHVGITIIRQPSVPDVPEDAGNNGPQIRHPPVQVNQGYDENQQFVSIGVFPMNAAGSDYGSDTQQYYNLLTPATNNHYPNANDDYRNTKQPYQNMNDDYRNTKQPYQNMNDDYRSTKQPYQNMNDDYRPTKPAYQNMNEDYRNTKQPYPNMNEDYRHNHEKPALTPNDNTQTAGYQVISIDLSALRNQNAEQPRSTNPVYNQQPERPVEPPQPPQPLQPPQPPNYRQQNEKVNSYGGRDKEFQQILIQIPHNILSEQSEKPIHGRGPNETPYTGTAQFANLAGNGNKPPNGPIANAAQVYNRPPPERAPPPNLQYSEKPRNPKEVHNAPQNGLLTNGINIAIIKQTESSNSAPIFKSSSDKRPQFHGPSVRTPSHPNPIIHRIPASGFSHGPPHRPFFGLPSKPFPPNNIKFHQGRDIPIVARTPYTIPVMRYNTRHNFAPYRTKPIVPHFGGHPGLFASSNLHYTTVNPAGARPPIYGNSFPMPPSISFPHASATKNNAQFVPGPGEPPVPINPAGSESAVPPFANNIPNGFGEINFDEINAFLNPNYDLFGSLANGPDKKKVEDETKFLQKVTSDLLSHDLNAANLAAGAVPPPFGVVKPPPPPNAALNVPFPYKYWEQPIRNFGPAGATDGSDRTRLMNYYSHIQHPHIRGNKNFPTIGKGPGRKRGLGKGYRGLKRKLSALRSSIRGKSKIAPRLEEASEESGNVESSVSKIASLIAGTKTFGNISPRSTIIKTERPGLDGVSIPLNPEHILSSRISTEEDENMKSDPMPPIIVYKGVNPPVEIYGSKDDIENVKKDNETEKATNDQEDKTEAPSKNSEPQEELEPQSSEESVQSYSAQDAGYINYMYSMLPELIRGSLNRRYDGDANKWLPVSPVEYAIAEDTYDRNETIAEKLPSPDKPETLGESKLPLNSSSSVEASSIEEDIEELFSLLGKEEKSDLVKE